MQSVLSHSVSLRMDKNNAKMLSSFDVLVHGFLHFSNNFFVQLTPNTLSETFCLEETQDDLSLIK